VAASAIWRTWCLVAWLAWAAECHMTLDCTRRTGARVQQLLQVSTCQGCPVCFRASQWPALFGVGLLCSCTGSWLLGMLTIRLCWMQWLVCTSPSVSCTGRCQATALFASHLGHHMIQSTVLPSALSVETQR
jgi:hypothetical protein